MSFSLDGIEKILERQVVGPGINIFRKGEAGDIAYIVMRGEVEIFTFKENNEPVFLAKVGRGQMFGEMSLLNNRTRTATAFTKDGAELLKIPHRFLQKKLGAVDPFVRYWVEYLANRVMDLSSRFEGPNAPP